MILTNCAACAAPLAHDAPRCVRCATRYCDMTCRLDHWRRGHKQMCKKIHRGGNAEQYHADKKYKEAVAVAVEACADDTKGQKCYICLEAAHPHTGEGLVRGCACGDRDGVSSPELGVAHVSCLARQAKILREEAEEHNLGSKVKSERWRRWYTCSLCEKKYHGVVRCALGWACWKTYLGRPEEDLARCLSMEQLGNGLSDVKRYEDALPMYEAALHAGRRYGSPEGDILCSLINIARCYAKMGRLDDTIAIEREVYARQKVLLGTSAVNTLTTGLNLVYSLIELEHYVEAKALGRELIPRGRHALGPEHDITLAIKENYALALYSDPAASREDIAKATSALEDTTRIRCRVLGPHHPHTLTPLEALEGARMRREDVAA